MTTALYRRYRPESFAEVIGQEQVTGPLSTALTKNRVNHAYLFSGPRGCGKTTSARILARCLNCVDGPTPTPCGVCPSCIELARGGPGSLDVVEIDAASHGGVDDARDLRERAAFAPVRDRFKVFIIDEAHMVSPQGFNALLKIVEEPPEHIRFIFATTEPEKVIGTIRSRTHHYPFRLVPPERLVTYLAELCEREGVQAGKGVLPLVVRSGGGSVRDSLSVLDQLIGGAGDEGLAYSTAVSLLGYTDVALLDDVTDALAAGDGGTVFRVIDRVIESGHDPRRFVEDLLERLRDLLVVAAMRDGGHAVFRGLPDDQLERMRSQAGRFGAAELSRAADIANAALTEMTGATSPRLQLELLCARLLLPSAEEGERGLAARLDRLEKRMNVSGGLVAAPVAAAVAAPAPAAPVVPAPLASAPPVTAPSAGPAGSSATAPADRPRPDAGGPTATVADWPEPSRPAGGEPRPTSAAPTSAAPTAAAPTSPGGPATPAPPLTAPSASAAPPAPPAPAASATGHGDLDAVRRMWTEVLNTLGTLKRTTWSLVSQYAQVLDYDGQRLLLGFDSAGRAQSFGRGAHPDFLRQALIDVIGLDCKVEAIASSAFRGGGSPGSPTSAGAPGPAPARATGAVRPPDPAVSSRTGAGGFADSGAGAGAGSAGTVPSGGPDASARAGSSAHADPSTHADPSGRSGAAGSAGPTGPSGTASPADAAGSAGPAGWSGEAGSSGGAGRSAGSNRSGRTPSTGSSAPHWTSPPPGAGSGPGGPASAARSEGATRPAGRRPSPPVSPYDDIPPPLEEPPDEEQLPPDDGRSGSRAWPTAAAVNRSAPAPATRPVVASTAPEPVISASPVARPSDHRAGPARRIDLADHGPSGDDPSLEASHLVGAQVVQQLLGGRVIEGHDQ